MAKDKILLIYQNDVKPAIQILLLLFWSPTTPKHYDF